MAEFFTPIWVKFGQLEKNLPTLVLVRPKFWIFWRKTKLLCKNETPPGQPQIFSTFGPNFFELMGCIINKLLCLQVLQLKCNKLQFTSVLFNKFQKG
jgi:hypothetical protein